MRWLAVTALVAAGCIEPGPRRERDAEWDRLAAQPLPDGNRRVVLDVYEFEARDSEAFRVALSLGSTAVFAWRANGVTALVGAPDFRARFEAESRSFRSRQHRTGVLAVADGYEASMAAVEQVPAVATAVIPIYDGAVVVRRLEVVPTGTGFTVRPRRLADGRIDVELTPWVRDLRRGVVAVTELATRVTVEAGRPVVLLAHETSSEMLGTHIFANGSRRVLMVVTVE